MITLSLLEADVNHTLLCLRGFLAVTPNALPFEPVGNVLGHVALVMFGEHSVGMKEAWALHRALGHDTLPFPEEIG
jgi:hypothetical protein